MRRRYLVLGVALITGLTLAAPTAAQEDDPPVELGTTPVVEESEFDSYVVVMKEDPLVVTVGRDNLRTSVARNRGQQMKADQERVMREVGVSPDAKISEYIYALNGFAANISHAEATKLAAHKDVALVLPDELYELTTDATPDFLGLTGPAGPWRTGVTGRGVVVGIIDTGIWPEHPSFEDRNLPAPPIDPLENIVVGDFEIGTCNFGNTDHHPDDAPFTCNNKLVGARNVMPTYRQVIGAEDFEFNSARDDNGHGSHTASTAAGNRDVEGAQILGNDLGRISGMAPDAHIIAYKGCGNLGCFGSDLALAIDIAVADGVDVINYSIGGTATAITVDELAFLFAANAGVHVATSAGNSGPGAATIRNPAKVPWLTTVGANTQPRFLSGIVELGDGRAFEGASVTGGTGPARLVDAADAAPDDLCRPGQLDPELVEGNIVLCRRGVIARVAKSLAVFQAGGVGMIMYENTDDDNLFSDTHWVPSVSVDNTPGLEIKAYIAEEGEDALAEIRDTAQKTEWPSAPSLTRFSSRGPNVFADVIKPDVTAPGMQVLAAYSPFTTPGFVQDEMFAAIAGTSMSSPHVAGILALLKQANPGWSPAMARSALMTTADQEVVDNDRVSPATPFGMGSGHLNPGGAVRRGSSFQPGLVYDAGFLDYLGFLCDAFPDIFLDPEATCGFLEDQGIPTRAVDLNYPSIGVAELTGTETVTRTVTSVAREAGNRRYTAVVEAPPGYSVTVEPSSFTIRRGQTQTFEVTITNETAPAGEWRFGSLTWRDQTGAYEVRSPIAVNASLLVAPDEISGSGVEGSASFDVLFGYNGSYTAVAHGLEAATLTEDNVEWDPGQSFDPNNPEASLSNRHEFNLSGVDFFRIALPPESVDDPANIDLDIYVFNPAGQLVGASFVPGTNEQVDIANPADGTWTVWVHGWFIPPGEPGANTDYVLHTWEISSTPGGSLVVDSAPDTAVLGEEGTIEVSWTGATAGEWHLGAVLHHGPGGEFLGRTLINVDNRGIEASD